MPPPNLPPDVVARTRIAALEEEFEASGEDARRALLRYEVGALAEHWLSDQARAETHYRAAYDLDPSFVPPLLALQRIYGADQRTPELERVLDARVKHASPSAHERAEALTEHARVLVDGLGQPQRAEALWKEALQTDPDSPDAALMLEHHYRGRGQPLEAEATLEKRAEQTADPALKGALLGELAWAAETRGDNQTALGHLQQASELAHGRFVALEALARVAQRSGDHELAAESIEEQAEMAARLARQADRSVEEDSEPVGRFGTPQVAGPHAAALYREAGWLRANACRDTDGALADYQAALRLDADPLLALEGIANCTSANEADQVAVLAAMLFETGVSGPDAAALHFRLAEFALLDTDLAAAIDCLRAAQAAQPESPAVMAVLEHSLAQQGDGAALAHHLRARAKRETGDAGELLLHATELLLSGPEPDFDAAHACLAELPNGDPEAQQLGHLARYRAALRVGNDEVRREASEHLCQGRFDDRCTAFLRRERYERALALQAPPEAVGGQLIAALEDPDCFDWAPHAARAFAAEHSDHGLLARAHLRLTEQTDDAGRKAAHHCAAARALFRAGKPREAESALRQALEHAPGNAYAVALLEELLLERGETRDAVELLRDNAATQADARHAELALLHAGMTAEMANELDDAAASYTAAAKKARDMLSPWWALYRIGQRSGNDSYRLTALEGLSRREQRRAMGMIATLELAEYHDAHGQPEAARLGLARALEHPDTEVIAALRIVLSSKPGSTLRDALHRLSVRCPNDPHVWETELAALQLSAGSSNALPDDANKDSFAQLYDADKDSFSQLSILQATDDPTLRSRALRRLADTNGARDADGQLRAALRLHAARCQRFGASDATAHAQADEQAQTLFTTYPGSVAAATAIEESRAAGHEARAAALAVHLEHSSPEFHYDLRLARARELLESGDGPAALAEARILCNAPAHNVASWELLRAAAHNEGDYGTVVVANDHLAAVAPGGIRAALLHESGRYLLEQLGDWDAAEQRLREALDVEPNNEEAFDRLHDLLVARGEAVGLVELLRDQLSLPMHVDRRVDLLYETAGLMRALGEHSAVLETVKELLELATEHVGGLGLLAESLASQRDYRGAVNALRRLAKGPIPDSHKQLVHRGAADFLERHLADPSGAYDALNELATAGLADAATYARMGDLARHAARMPEAAAACERAAQMESGKRRAHLYKQAAELYRDQLNNDDDARINYERALLAAPTDAEACESLLALMPTLEGREKKLNTFERAVHLRLGSQPADAPLLRTLAKVGAWRQDSLSLYTALDGLAALGLADADESRARDTLFSALKPWPTTPLSFDALQVLRKDRDGGPAAEIAMLVSSAVAGMLGESPRKLRLRRRQRLPDDDALVAELQQFAEVCGVRVAGVYMGGEAVNGIRLLAQGSHDGVWVVGEAVVSPLSSQQRFEVGRQALAQYASVWPLFSQSKTLWRDTVLATALAAELEITGDAPQADLRPLARRINRHMPRPLRRELLKTALPLGRFVETINVYLQAAEASHLRAGLLLSGELEPALRAAVGPTHHLEAVSHSLQALDLLRFWTSPRLLALHRQGSPR